MTISIIAIVGRPEEGEPLAEDFVSQLADNHRMVVPVGLGEAALEMDMVMLAGDTIFEMAAYAQEAKMNIAFVCTGVTSQSRIRMISRVVPAILLSNPDTSVVVALAKDTATEINMDLLVQEAGRVKVFSCSPDDPLSLKEVTNYVTAAAS